jgi:hypothetical protein
VIGSTSFFDSKELASRPQLNGALHDPLVKLCRSTCVGFLTCIRPLDTTCEGSRMQQAWACCDGVVRSVGMVIGLWCRVGSFRLIATDGG